MRRELSLASGGLQAWSVKTSFAFNDAAVITQGILVAGSSTYVNQIFKQLSKEE